MEQEPPPESKPEPAPAESWVRSEAGERHGHAILVTSGAALIALGPLLLACRWLLADFSQVTGASFAIAFALGMVLGSLGIILSVLVGVWPIVLGAEWLARRFRRRRYGAELLLCVLLALLPWLVLAVRGGWAAGLAGWLVHLPFLAVYWWSAKAHQLGYSLGQMLRWENAGEQARFLFAGEFERLSRRNGNAPR
jgi:hypothetical protein